MQQRAADLILIFGEFVCICACSCRGRCPHRPIGEFRILKISVKSVQSAWADVGIGPYNAFKNRVGIFELFLVSRERSKKTEAVFLVASRRSGGKSKSPGPQMISICVLTLTRTSLTAEYYSAQVHLNGMERYRQVCRMHRIICAWPHSSSAIFSSIQRCVPAFSASASYASCAACSSE